MRVCADDGQAERDVLLLGPSVQVQEQPDGREADHLAALRWEERVHHLRQLTQHGPWRPVSRTPQEICCQNDWLRPGAACEDQAGRIFPSVVGEYPRYVRAGATLSMDDHGL